MNKKLREWITLNRELMEDFTCAIVLLGVIVFALTVGLGGPK